MLILTVALAGVVAWLVQQLLRQLQGSLRERAAISLVAVVVAAAALGIALSKSPVLGRPIDHRAARFAGTVGVAYDPADAVAGASTCPVPHPTRPAAVGRALTASRTPGSGRYLTPHPPASPTPRADALRYAESERTFATDARQQRRTPESETAMADTPQQAAGSWSATAWAVVTRTGMLQARCYGECLELSIVRSTAGQHTD